MIDAGLRGGDSRHALIVSFTPVTDEPRVLRQGSALRDAGWRVSVAGYAGRQAPQPYWRLIEFSQTPGIRARTRRQRRSGTRNIRLARFSARAAERGYWDSSAYSAIYEQLAFIDVSDYDLILAHDWFATPIAARLASKLGVAHSTDVHEYARGQYMADRRWRWKERPWIHSLQKRFYPTTPLTTICDGIADLLAEEYELADRPTVVRSTARRQDLPVRETADRIVMLYHGIIAQTRGLEQAIASAPLWRPEFHLIIRGAGPDEYLAELAGIAEKHGVSDRITLEGPVPASQMIELANRDADVGFFVQPDLSPQKRFTLPNKFFEYVMAGLCLCVSDLPEMARLVHEHDLGVLVPDTTPEAIAAAVNSLDAATVDRFKQQSAEAAKTLNWDVEQEVMLKLYDRLAPARTDDVKPAAAV